MTFGANWTPLPLVSIEAGHRKSMQSGSDNTVGLNLNWNFGRSLDWHLSPDAVADQRSLAGSRYELVSRNNQIVMDYREQTLLTFSLAHAVKGSEGSTQALGVSVWAKHGLAKIVWDDAALAAAGGKIIGTGANSQLVLPAYQDGASNLYTLSGVAYDTKGKASPRAQVQITVEKAEQSAPEESAQPDAGQSTIIMSSGELVADGSGKVEVAVELKDKDGNPLSNEANNLRLDATMQNMLRSAEAGVTVGQFTEDKQHPGRYLVDVTAGNVAGVVTLTLYYGNTQLGQQQTLTLTPKETSVGEVTKLMFTSRDNRFVAGNNISYTVIATDRQGNPVKGAVLEFMDREGNTLIADNGGITNEEGKASVTLIKEKAGEYNVQIRVAGAEQFLVDKTYDVIADVASARVVDSQTTSGQFQGGIDINMVRAGTFTLVVQDRFNNPVLYQTAEVMAEKNGQEIQITLNKQGLTNVKGEVSGEAILIEPVQWAESFYDLYVVIAGKRVEGEVVQLGFNRVP